MDDLLDTIDTDGIVVEELAIRACETEGLCCITETWGPFRFDADSGSISTLLDDVENVLGIEPEVVRNAIRNTDRDGRLHEVAMSNEKPGVSLFIQRCCRHEPDRIYLGPSDYLSKLPQPPA